MTRWSQGRTARALARFPVHRLVRGAERAGAALDVSPCSTTRRLRSLFLKEQSYWNSDTQELCQLAILQGDQILKGL